MKSILAYTLIYLYIYSVHFFFLPKGTRVMMGVFGFIWFSLIFIQKRSFLKIPINFTLVALIVLLFIMGFIALLSVAYNRTSDFYFFSQVFSMILVVFSSYFIIMLLKKLKYKLDFHTISKLIINVVLIELIIAFVMFLIPEIRDVLLSFRQLSEKALSIVSYVTEFRIVGFGASYFDAGMVSGFALILIAVQIRTFKFTPKQLILLSVKFLVILAVGMMMARTTMVGAILALTIICIPKNLRATLSILKTRALFFFSIVIIPIIVTSIILFLFPSVSEVLAPIFEYGFEMFVNYFEKGSFETESTNDLQTMYIFPTEVKTWIIGDGYFAHPIDIDSYYMHTDVGYLRIIYYFGILGLISYFSFQIYSIVLAYRFFDIKKQYYLFLVAYFFILNLKGLTDLFFIHILFIMVYLLKDKKEKLNK